ncbi:MAG: type II secretion system secretin GspD, partial [Thermodesulfobacteriota bacterium]
IAELLDISYIIDPQVKGVVNIRSGKKIPMAQLATVFRKLLNINGLDIRSEGEYNYIYMTKNPGSHLVFGPDKVGKLKDSPRFIIQVVPVMHLPASEAKKLLAPYISEQGRMEVLTGANTLFVTDYESKVVDVMTILARLDISPLAELKVRLVRVEKAALFDVRDELNDILGALQVNNKGHDGVTILALERGNALLLVSSNQEILDSTTRWITELDVVPSEGRDNIYIYNVRNSVASELAGLVNDLISDSPGTASRSTAPRAKASDSGSKTAGSKGKDASKTLTASRAPAVRKTGSTKKGTGGETPGLRWAGEPNLIPDDSRNIILIRALPPDYSRLVKLLERLDNMPRQVLIEVMVAEVTLSEFWELGIEWGLTKISDFDGRNYRQNITSNVASIANDVTHSGLTDTAAGLTYSILNSAGEAAGLLHTIADDNELTILSSPQVMVLNNEKATVNVGQQVPVITSQTNDTTSSTVSNQTIQYQDTGVILEVTPKINYDGIIILDINQQVSSAVTNTFGGTESPVISKRELNTKLAVRDGQTVFMGGLIENNVNIIENGVPFLKDIPLLGWLFKYQKEVNDKTELLVMITPYVIESEDVLEQYVSSFKTKMDDFRSRLKGNSKAEK